MSNQSKYPWKKWFSKRRFTLIKDKHYFCMTHCMSVLIRRAAKKFNVNVSIQTLSDGKLKVKVF